MGTEWLRYDEQGEPIMALADKVKALRNEQGWSQTELGERIGADPAQISRYENGRITPSADAVGRLAEVFGVSCDYLLVEGAPRRPFRSPEDALGDHLADFAELGPADRELVVRFIDALVAKTRMKALSASI